MKISTLPRRVLRIEYAAARFPLQVVGQNVVARLPDDAPVRVGFERLLGAADQWAGQFLDDEAIRRRGVILLEHSDALARATKLEKQAQERRSQADMILDEEVNDAKRKQQQAAHAQQQQISEARRMEQAQKRDAQAAAKKRSTVDKKAATDQATKTQAAAEARKRAAQRRIASDEKRATQPAKAQLSDASAKRASGRLQKTEADRLDDLADIEKQNRQSSK